jgi:hypothetical protein
MLRGREVPQQHSHNRFSARTWPSTTPQVFKILSSAFSETLLLLPGLDQLPTWNAFTKLLLTKPSPMQRPPEMSLGKLML